MAAPGMNLDFYGGSGFIRRAKALQGLTEAVKQALQSAPPTQGILAWEFKFRGRDYGIVLNRRAQKVGLMYVFDLPREENDFHRTLADIRKRYPTKEGP